MLGHFTRFLSSADFFLKINFCKKFKNTIRVSSCLDPDQDDVLGPNCLQRLSADNKCSYIARKELRAKVPNLEFSKCNP